MPTLIEHQHSSLFRDNPPVAWAFVRQTQLAVPQLTEQILQPLLRAPHRSIYSLQREVIYPNRHQIAQSGIGSVLCQKPQILGLNFFPLEEIADKGACNLYRYWARSNSPIREILLKLKEARSLTPIA
jgi:hypothetical protein